MFRLVSDKFSTFYDLRTRAQFASTLDRRSGLFVGVAHVSDRATAEDLCDRCGARVVSDEEWLAMTVPAPLPEKDAPVTGDVLPDIAQEAAETPETAPVAAPEGEGSSSEQPGTIVPVTEPTTREPLPAPPAPPGKGKAKK